MFTLNIIRNILRKPVQQVSFFKVNATCLASPTLRLYANGANLNSEAPIEYRNITKDRKEPVPIEKSINYLKSNAYRLTYGDDPVWVKYRRNHKGALPPKKTRRTCIRKGIISTGNPCPICRDEYLVLNENNTELLNQFISPNTGAILSYQVTGLCQKRHQELMVNVQRAKDRGLLTFDVPFRKYDYSYYYKPEKQ